MIAKSVFNYLEPYLPYQVVYGISMIAFLFERFIIPKVDQVYSNASLDPKTLLPFIISAVALYLSIVSIYHAFKAALRMVWFMIKWSLMIIAVWFVLATVNDFRHRSEGSHKIGKDLFDNYQKTLYSWWNGFSLNTINLNDQLGFDPLKLILDHGSLSFFEPFLAHFLPQHHQKSSSFPPPNVFSSDQFSQTRAKTRSSNDAKFDLPKLLQDFWIQSVQTPIQSIIKQSQSKSHRSQTDSGSGTHNR